MKNRPKLSFWTAAAVIIVGNWGTAAPSVVYPQYAREWGLSPVVTTTVFSTYGVVLAIVLIFFGGISDAIGRRAAMVGGLAFLAAGALLLAFAPSVGWLYAARVAQGVGIGLSLGAASASLVDFNVNGHPGRPSSVNTLSNSIGLLIATVAGGAIVQYLPAPTRSPFWILFVLTVLVLIASLWMPRHDAFDSDGSSSSRGWRPRPIGVPRGSRRIFLASAFIGFTGLGIGGILLSLGAQIAKDLIDTTNVFVQGLLLGISSLVLGVVAIVFARVAPKVASVVGGVAGAAALLLFIPASVAHAMPVFVASQVLGGVAIGFGLLGGVGFIHRYAPAHHRAKLISAFYLVCYLAQGSVSAFGGIVATRVGLANAILIFAPTVAVIAVAAAIIAASTRIPGTVVQTEAHREMSTASE